MKALLLGSNGQLGWELKRTKPDNISLTTCDYPKVDFCSTNSINQCINTIQPDCIINTAAYTAVDEAEREKNLAYRINHLAVFEIATLCMQNKISLVHISTDFVFDGRNYRPYKPDDIPEPESVYGRSKLKGEQAIIETMGDKALIIRTAWLYSSHGRNFVKTMLDLMKKRQNLNVIDEQIGTPTWANGLACAIWTALENNIKGTFHWTDAGVASWYDFAVAIHEEGLKSGLLEKFVSITPVGTHQYPTPAKRPMYSILDKTSFWRILKSKPVHWRVQLRFMMKELL